MNKAFILLICVLAISPCFAQGKYEPTILILSPNEIGYDKALFGKDIVDCNKQLTDGARVEIANAIEEAETQSENAKMMLKSEIDFLKALDFSKQVSYISEQLLLAHFYENFPNILILIKDTGCEGNILALKKISDEQHFRYVLNFPKMELYKESGVSHVKIRVQLFEQSSNTILLDKEYLDEANHMETCDKPLLNCLVDNTLLQALPEIMEIVAHKDK